MDVPSYPPPVDKLLTLGDGREVAGTRNQWSTYLELGLGPEHIPDLIRMATDEALPSHAFLCKQADRLQILGVLHKENNFLCSCLFYFG